MSFVPLMYLEFSMVSEMCFTSETGLSVCGSVRNHYVAIQCLTFNVHCKFLFYGIFCCCCFDVYLLKLLLSCLWRTNNIDYTALTIQTGIYFYCLSHSIKIIVGSCLSTLNGWYMFSSVGGKPKQNVLWLERSSWCMTWSLYHTFATSSCIQETHYPRHISVQMVQCSQPLVLAAEW